MSNYNILTQYIISDKMGQIWSAYAESEKEKSKSHFFTFNLISFRQLLRHQQHGRDEKNN